MFCLRSKIVFNCFCFSGRPHQLIFNLLLLVWWFLPLTYLLSYCLLTGSLSHLRHSLNAEHFSRQIVICKCRLERSNILSWNVFLKFFSVCSVGHSLTQSSQTNRSSCAMMSWKGSLVSRLGGKRAQEVKLIFRRATSNRLTEYLVDFIVLVCSLITRTVFRVFIAHLFAYCSTVGQWVTHHLFLPLSLPPILWNL